MVDTRAATGFADHRAPEPGGEHPLVQTLPGVPERGVEREPVAGAEPVERDREVMHANLGHDLLLFANRAGETNGGRVGASTHDLMPGQEPPREPSKRPSWSGARPRRRREGRSRGPESARSRRRAHARWRPAETSTTRQPPFGQGHVHLAEPRELRIPSPRPVPAAPVNPDSPPIIIGSVSRCQR